MLVCYKYWWNFDYLSISLSQVHIHTLSRVSVSLVFISSAATIKEDQNISHNLYRLSPSPSIPSVTPTMYTSGINNYFISLWIVVAVLLFLIIVIAMILVICTIYMKVNETSYK